MPHLGVSVKSLPVHVLLTSDDGDQVIVLADLDIGSGLYTQSRDGSTPTLSVTDVSDGKTLTLHQ